MNDVWRSWAELTRFLESARISFARERMFLDSLELEQPETANLKVRVQKGWFRTRLDQHLQAIGDEQILHGSVLIHTYALAEAAASTVLGRDADGGIEKWGTELLESHNADWSHVRDGKEGAVEVAVIRNAFAHGTRTIDSRGANRLSTVGSSLQWPAGHSVTLPYELLLTLRGRLQSLLNVGGLRA